MKKTIIVALASLILILISIFVIIEHKSSSEVFEAGSDIEASSKDINKIRKSDFFNRISNTYLFSRSYDRMIASTDSNKTFYFCLV